MFDFFRKPKMSCRDLAETLAPKFVALTIQMFEIEKDAFGDQSCINNADQTPPSRLLQEWILFCLAAYIQGCRTSMRQDQIHFSFATYFLELVARNTCDEGIFQTIDEFMGRSHERVEEYLAAFSGSRSEDHKMSEDPIMKVAQAFLTNIGFRSGDIFLEVGASDNFVNQTILTKNLFDKIQGSYRLVP